MKTVTYADSVPHKNTPRKDRTGFQLDHVKVGKVNSVSKRKVIEKETEVHHVIWPWRKSYKAWWGLTVFCAVLTVLTETYAVAFSPAGLHPDSPISIIEYTLVSIFVIDIVVNFNLVYYDEHDHLISVKKEIAVHYLKGLFWLDFAGVFPFYVVALAITGEIESDSDSDLAAYLSLIRLVKLVRLHRMKQLFDVLQYNPHVSLMMLTLLRNFGFAILWSHFAACIFYFIARQQDFDPDSTWIGGSIEGLDGAQRYIASLYWSIVTFTTVGYGDYSPVNPAEQIWGMIYMLLNMVATAWIIGSITLLIVKQDEKTGAYREAIKTLRQYSKLHDFPKRLEKRLRGQLQLDFNNNEISDEHVLGHFPTETRRKILRRLYLPAMMQTHLMRDVRQQFVDAFLTACKVEIFSAGEEILQRGAISTDLYLLVAGCANLMPTSAASVEQTQRKMAYDGLYGGTSIGERRGVQRANVVTVSHGEFINAISFFTETPQMETVRTKTVCKTLTLSRAAYKMLAGDHPGSIGKLLKNLLHHVEDRAGETGEDKRVSLTKQLTILRAGSIFESSDDNSTVGVEDCEETIHAIQVDAQLTAVRDLVKMHLNRLKEDHTMRFLFAASRGDTETITVMCDQGFDPNSRGFDNRTALMVAAMKGNTEAVERILEYHASPNLVDMHGSSALYAAARNGHDETMDVLLKYGAKLCINETDAASRGCQAVFHGDILTLRRLLKAGLSVNGGDYDNRRPAHIAAAEGNLAALKILIEFGADLNVKDRWGKTIEDEANISGFTQVLEYLNRF